MKGMIRLSMVALALALGTLTALPLPAGADSQRPPRTLPEVYAPAVLRPDLAVECAWKWDGQTSYLVIAVGNVATDHRATAEPFHMLIVASDRPALKELVQVSEPLGSGQTMMLRYERMQSPGRVVVDFGNAVRESREDNNTTLLEDCVGYRPGVVPHSAGSPAHAG